ncbi:Cysteine Protease [Parasponia andersonii]|uniref:Cysteine Protease n=1 Tax=Parasponia andersonii TaxID=3476 RepID=A0A2P5AB53_PARAD|nr:Cysteine Protease [Parasponia andersonii]
MGSTSNFTIVALLILGTWASQAISQMSLEAAPAKKHEEWMAQYGRNYADNAEKEKRFKIFNDNVNFIEQFNKYRNRTYKMRVNGFADLTKEEFLSQFTGFDVSACSSGLVPGRKLKSFRYENLTDVPGTVDWRNQGAVTPVKNQRRCGNKSSMNIYEKVPSNSEEALQKAVYIQPVSVAVDATNFQFYSKGVVSDDCGTRLNHGVTIIGYGTTEDNTKYWLVKNSWGEDWGEKGYIRILRDSDSPGGQCGIAMVASYPIIA